MNADFLETSRLTLIPADEKILRSELKKERFPDLLKDITIPQNWPHHTITNDVIEAFLLLLEQNRLYNFYWIYNNNLGERILIGSGGIMLNEDFDYEIGYSVLEQFENNGFATEAIICIIQWFANSALGERLIAKTEKNNQPSIRVLEKVGFILSSEEKESNLLIYSCNI